jgi:hypothetical protein
MDEKRLQINSPRLGLQPSLSWLLILGYRVSKPNTEYRDTHLDVDYNCHFSLSFAYIGYRVSSTDHRPLITEYRVRTTETLTLTWTTTVIFHYHLPIVTTESRVPTTDYRLPRHSPWRGLQLSFFIIICLYWLLSLEYWPPTTDHRVPSTEYRPPSTEYRVPSTEYRPPMTKYWVPSTDHQVPSTGYWQIQFVSIWSTRFRVLTLDTWWFVQWVENGHVAYIFSGLGLRTSALSTRNSMICVM